MKKNYLHAMLICITLLMLPFYSFSQFNFPKKTPSFEGFTGINAGTSLIFGPDGRLYVTEYQGEIKIYEFEKDMAGNYSVSASEIITSIQDIQDHNDDGTLFEAPTRQVTGITVVGSAETPLIYITSSDIRAGGGYKGGFGDSGLDTNSGVITRLTKTDTGWDAVDLVRGLPRSEENHSTNALEFVNINGTEYLIVASGGNTNGGGPSKNFAYASEYALSSALLSVNLLMINNMPIKTDNGRNYIYDLPTLDDPTRDNVNGIIDPDDPAYDGIDINDPFGGNNGLNQAIVDPTGPVQIFSGGYRNAYDMVLTETGIIYTTDNGGNSGWGGFPENEGDASSITNNYTAGEPGSNSSSGGEYVNNLDQVIEVTSDLQNYVWNSYYAGHPNPVRANPEGAGLFIVPSGNFNNAYFATQPYDPDGSTPGSTTDPNNALPANWPPVPVSMANPEEADYRGPGINNPDGPNDDNIVAWSTNANAIDEYTTSNFDDGMKGNLIVGVNDGTLRRIALNPDGSLDSWSELASGIDTNPLGVYCSSDSDPYPGTIWLVTQEGNLIVLEPGDNLVCLDETDPMFEPNADYDGDGYTNQDELDNGTDICNAGSTPNDFDSSAGGAQISDLNDEDDDNDGIPDADDPFQIGDVDNTGSDAFSLPVLNEFYSSNPILKGYLGLGFTGMMNNGDTGANWLNWLDRRDDPNDPNPNDVIGGATGIMTMHMTSGTALGNTNTQEKAFQYGIQLDQNTSEVTIQGALINLSNGPVRLYGANAPTNGELGLFIGDGTQSNYIKLVITPTGLTALQEINDTPQTPISLAISEGDRPNNILLFFIIDPSTGNVRLEYRFETSDVNSVLGTIQAQGEILQAIQDGSKDLAIGLIGTSNDPNLELEGSWDFLNAFLHSTVRINAGGPDVTSADDGPDWEGNPTTTAFTGERFSTNGGKNFASNLTFANKHSSIPDYIDEAIFNAIFATERWDEPEGEEMQYNVPLPEGEYQVNLFIGNSFDGTSEPNTRLFDVSMEGEVVIDDVDLSATFGHLSGGMFSVPITVVDGELNIEFIHVLENPLVNAIEIVALEEEFPEVVLGDIEDQVNNIGDAVDLGASASGGNPNANFTYAISGQPEGVMIGSVDGIIGGSIDVNAGTGGANSDGIYDVVVTVFKTGSLTQTTTFTWTVNGSWEQKTTPDNFTGRHENSFVQAGEKFYLMGGRENPKDLDIYDYTNNTWTTLSNSVPKEFNHSQAVEYKGLVWVIGAFQTNNFPSEVPTEYIWMFNPAKEVWIQGPEIPKSRQRGSAGVVVYNDKFYIIAGNTDGHNEGGSVNWADEYDPATGIWRVLPNAPNNRDHFHAVVIGSKLYVAGGRQSSYSNGNLINTFKPVIKEVDVFDFTTETWSSLSASQNIPTGRGGSTSVNFNDKLIVMGGEVQTEDVYGETFTGALKIVEQFDPNTNTWQRLPDMTFARHGTQAITSGDGIFIAAGSPVIGGGNQKTFEFFGQDNPSGTAVQASAIDALTEVLVPINGTAILGLSIITGNVATFIKSIEISGSSEFSIISGDLENVLLDPMSTHDITIGLSDNGADEEGTLIITYDNDDTLEVSLKADNNLSVEKNNEFNSSISLFPNPATQKAYIGKSKNHSIEQISIYDIGGRLVQNISKDKLMKNGNYIELNLSQISNGIYAIFIQNDKNEVAQRKLVVNNSK